MATDYELTDATPTAPITYQGWESFVFVSGDFAGGRMTTEFSPDESNWFADSNLTFRQKGFETFRGAPSIRYRFRINGNLTGTPNVKVQIA